MDKNIIKIQSLIEKYKIDCLVMINKECSDTVFCKYIINNITTLSLCFVFKNRAYVLLHDLEKDNKYNYLNNITYIYYKDNIEFIEKIEDILSDNLFVVNIGLPYSTFDDKDIDILGHGEYLKYTKIFKNIYKKYNKKLTIKSSEKVIYSLLQEKSEDEILKLKNLCNITEDIFIKSFKKIQVGMSEKDIYNKIRECFNDVTKKYIKDNINSTDIIYFDYSWENCPIVLTGENLIKGGHTLPSDKLLKFGDTIYIDFGICATYKNGNKLYTDLQRMGYALNIKEKVVPSNVQKVFNTLVNSIEESLDYIKPCVKGYKIDDIVRNYILNKGYPNYNHATGHPVGNKVHDVGAVITNKLQKRSSIELVKNGVYTIEPRIAIQNGGSIEEMIQVTDFGGIPISNIQKKLYVI